MNFKKRSSTMEGMAVDESEVWKRKNLMSVDNIRKMENAVYIFMLIVSVLVVAACIYAYFFDTFI